MPEKSKQNEIEKLQSAAYNTLEEIQKELLKNKKITNEKLCYLNMFLELGRLFYKGKHDFCYSVGQLLLEQVKSCKFDEKEVFRHGRYREDKVERNTSPPIKNERGSSMGGGSGRVNS